MTAQLGDLPSQGGGWSDTNIPIQSLQMTDKGMAGRIHTYYLVADKLNSFCTDVTILELTIYLFI